MKSEGDGMCSVARAKLAGRRLGVSIDRALRDPENFCSLLSRFAFACPKKDLPLSCRESTIFHRKVLRHRTRLSYLRLRANVQTSMGLSCCFEIDLLPLATTENEKSRFEIWAANP
jgi:hypothetical protein